MSNYRLWSPIEQIGAAEFGVIVTAVNNDDPGDAKPVQRLASSRQAAECLRRDLLIEAGDTLRLCGDRVVDVEADESVLDGTA